ncbi:MAG: transferase hexapeptide repeat family protein [Lacibacter sp.]
MFYKFKGFIPVVHPSSFVHPLAAVTGNVIIGKNCYIGPGAALRGDWGGIVLEDGCNVQENCTIHMFPGITVRLQEGAHIGHGAIVHGAQIGRNCLVGMNSVLMDHVVLGDECIVGAMSFVKEGSVFEARSLIIGNPAKRIREVSDEMINWKTKGTALYQALPAEMHANWESCEPLQEPEAVQFAMNYSYETWGTLKNQENKK